MTTLLILLTVYAVGVAASTALFAGAWGFPFGPALAEGARWPLLLIERLIP